MRPIALFLNVVFEGVLKEIIEVQQELPEQIMFLQPHSGRAITKLPENPPTVDDPMLLLMSVTDDLPTVQFAGEIVGWDDKTDMTARRRNVLNRLVHTLQPREGGLYDASRSKARQSVNVLSIRRLRRLKKPFKVTRLRKAEDAQTVSDNRTTAGGWTYVSADGVALLLK